MKRIHNRYVILAIAAIVNFVHGNAYVWTVFQPHVREEYGLSAAASSQPFTVIVGIFFVGNMIGGFLQHRIGAKKTIFAGAAAVCIGGVIAAFAPYNMPGLISVGYGVLGGLGSGCAFSMLVAVPQDWFPDKRGLVTGITVGVVGISGIIMNPVCDYLLSAYGYRAAMLIMTAIYAVLYLGTFFIEEAPSKLVEFGEEIEYEQKQYTTKEMVRTRAYYAMTLVMAFAVPAYVLVNPLMKSLGMERGLTSSQALVGVLIASVANIIGRFATPWLSDRAGCKSVIQVLYVLDAIAVLGLTVARGNLFVVLISVVCLVYGGVVSVFPVLVCQKFGMKYQGMNFGAVMAGYGITSVLCPYLLEIAGQGTSLIVAGVACVTGLLGTRYF